MSLHGLDLEKKKKQHYVHTNIQTWIMARLFLEAH